ncbi:MAG TPA: RNA polymerase sigma-70 factor [Candidatus Limnocylindrales bacterium]|nr:RNA polymerase sigma-70 factor [Candidatus Limnocylindrales bacterium]
MSDASTQVFVEHRSLLVGVAYRVLGTVADSEDVVQDAWLRWSKVAPDQIEDPRAYLVTVTTRLAIDRLRRRQVSREQYVGEWLPEPIVTDADPASQAEVAESVSMGLLLVLETLTPLERAVFVLHDAFGFGYAQIATMLDRTEPAVRKLGSRARRHVHDRRPRYNADQSTQRAVTEGFLAAASHGDIDGLMAVLAPEVTLVADGGGKARAPLLPVIGAHSVARFFLAVAGRLEPGQSARAAVLNGEPALIVDRDDGKPIAAAVLSIPADRIERIYLVANPDKLVNLEIVVTFERSGGGAL